MAHPLPNEQGRHHNARNKNEIHNQFDVTNTKVPSNEFVYYSRDKRGWPFHYRTLATLYVNSEFIQELYSYKYNLNIQLFSQ